MRFGVVAALAFGCAMLVGPVAAEAAAPHVAQTEDTDVCAMCHRVKTAITDADTEWSRAEASATGDAGDLRNALLVGSEASKDDTGLCYSCHGVERMGSAVDVQSSFEAAGSGHLIAPDSSDYGRSPKQCSTCHDSHGENKVAGQPRARLLRSVVTTTQVLYTGAEYCAGCHADRPADRWDGLDVWNDTAHASVIPTPASGTGIVCSVCHDPHGSDIAPSLEPTIMPPAVLPAGGLGVAANDRSFCLLCHSSSGESWVGSATYAPSAHGSSAATVAIAGEWAARDLSSAESSRAVGECQSCHAPMGSKDASGTIPKMAERRGRQLCDDCHDHNGPAASNIATLAFPASRVDTEVVAVWRPSAETSTYGDTAVYSRDLTSAVPAGLDGPRVFRPSFRTGDASAGDIDGDGKADLLVADPTRAVVDRFRSDPVRGLRRTSLSLSDGAKPYLLTLANVVQNGVGPHGAQDARAEVAVIARDPEPPHASRLHVYTFDGAGLELLGVSLNAGNDASGLAAGDLDGDGHAEIVATAAGDDQFRVFTELGAGVIAATGPHSTGAGTKPRGVSIGDVWAHIAGDEIVVCYPGVTANNVGVFSRLGAPLQTYTTSGAANANRAYDSVVADVLWNETPAGTSGKELVVALRSDPETDAVLATSSIDVFKQLPAPGTGLGTPVNHSTGLRYESSAVEAGDIDGDGRAEAVVGNSGKWVRGSSYRAPSLQVFDSAAGSALALSSTLWSTGVEQASGIHETTTTALGTAPSVVVADLGAVGPARHPGDAGSVTHVSTETAGFGRHVTCADCHNPHETTATVQSAPPAVYGAVRGAWGVRITNTGAGAATYSQEASVTAEYQVCLKCHSAYSNLDGTRDIASEVNTRNASMHAVEGASLTASATASTFVTPTAGYFVNSAGSWTKDSKLYCIDCHTNSDPAQAAGPHVSGEGALLRAPYWGTTSSASDLLCYLCHKRNIYYAGDVGSLFIHPNKPDMHRVHTSDYGFSCRTCHVSHGAATLPHLQNSDHEYEHNQEGGACTTACHTGGARHQYTRGITTPPSGLGVSFAASFTGGLGSVLTRGDADQLAVAEANGSSPAYSIETTFTGLGALPSGVEFYGRYDGAAGHIVRVQAWDYSSALPDKWTNIGVWPTTAVPGIFSFALTDPDYLSGGTLRVRVVHTSPGNPNHKQFIDSLWVNP